MVGEGEKSRIFYGTMGFGSVGLVFIENNLCQFIDIIAVVRYIWNCLIVMFVSLFFFDRKPASNAAGTRRGAYVTDNGK